MAGKKSDEKHYTDASLNKVLPEDVKAVYKVVNIGKRSTKSIYLPKFGIIQFDKISLKKAEQLVKNKFPYLVHIKPPTTK